MPTFIDFHNVFGPLRAAVLLRTSGASVMMRQMLLVGPVLFADAADMLAVRAQEKNTSSLCFSLQTRQQYKDVSAAEKPLLLHLVHTSIVRLHLYERTGSGLNSAQLC